MTYDKKLKIKVGLTPTYGENGEIEFIGSDSQWNEFERLVSEFEENGIDYRELPF